jgi:predicted NUDIX family NTP pyrophosphohydrolase
MTKVSAGLLAWRVRDDQPEVLLVHPGGPFYAKKDAGVWTIPKGELEAGEDPLVAARREFEEETGFAVEGRFVALTPVKLKSGKLVHAWAVLGDCDPDQIRGNRFSMEWPPRSGTFREFPEIDRAAFFRLAEARTKIHAAQVPLLDELNRIWRDAV